ncbi:ester cyclase [Novosphingobium sp. JCM 18896]|uniref:ester cyclase n=1 Tax=Novosphingobium sp. JCM 18896 TaxID=2989731 RepID=UPI002221CA6A|nr:ester cyclase [Novosphingobium sp. JCM 18896]MCW1432324.1 ester cyclase [Novosphingobium sp. JCM 18896]
MHILYSSLVEEGHLTPDQRATLRGLKSTQGTFMASSVEAAGGGSWRGTKNFGTAQDWVTAFFDKGAEEVLGYYADDFVWEDIEFMQTITTKEDLYKAFVVFNNSGPESPFGIHKFEVLTFDSGPAGQGRAQKRTGDVPPEWQGELVADYNRFANGIFLGADLDYDEWGYMQWIWKATHNEDFFGIPAAGKTTVTRGTTTQMYKNGKIVRCRTHWNFREFAIQLGVIPPPDEAWRNNPGLNAN